MELKSEDEILQEQRWSSLVHKLGFHTENVVDLVRNRFRRRMLHRQPMTIVPFHGMGNGTVCRLRGRVLESQRETSDDANSIWSNLQDSYRRFESDEVPDVAVRLDVLGHQYQVVTDEEGYFTFEFPCPSEGDDNKLIVALTLPDHIDQHDKTYGTVFFPSSKAAFGVVSDIDDTILVTQATSIIQMMRLTLLESSSSRVPFTGVREFYDELGANRNPFFYVSSSPWNLFEFLVDFMKINGIAPGPLLLRDFGVDRTKLISGPHKTHKLAQIRSVLEFYPDLPFILIGDSGQHDPEIYTQIVTDFPGRILAIYIRDVGDATRDRQIQALAAQLQSAKVDMLLVPDTLAAANHAASRGYIDASLVSSVADAVHNEKIV